MFISFIFYGLTYRVFREFASPTFLILNYENAVFISWATDC